MSILKKLFSNPFRRKQPAESTGEPWHSQIDEAALQTAIAQDTVAEQIATKHFPNKILTSFHSKFSGDVVLRFTDDTQALITGDEAKAIREAQ